MNQNELYPIFLKVNILDVLIVGGGDVALEKLSFLLKSSPNAKVVLVTKTVHQDIIGLGNKHDVSIIIDNYSPLYLNEQHLVIVATDNKKTNQIVYNDSKARHLLVNVADNPKLCDFYLGGIVTKGDVKIAVSTNGRSPTLAKRLRQYFEKTIPNEINNLASSLNIYRNDINGDFQQKVKELNDLTELLIK
jgi:precorrin-2 dehydrogenase/sirohydrochlorin ferrochelatase